MTKTKVTAQEKIARAQATLAKAEARLEVLELKEAKRILGIARRVGFFDQTVSDEQLENALKAAMAASEKAANG